MLSIFAKWSRALRKRRLLSERSAQQSYRVIVEDKKGAGQSCMNCKVPLTGPFCHICGQKDDELRRPIWTFFRELLDSVFSADSRLIKSILLIMLVPGGLTRAYSMGRRARFVPPLRLYLSVSVMFFAILWLFDILILDIKLTPKDTVPETPEISETTGESPPKTPKSPVVKKPKAERTFSDDFMEGFNSYEAEEKPDTSTDTSSDEATGENSDIPTDKFLKSFKEGLEKGDLTFIDIEKQMAELPDDLSDKDKETIRQVLLNAQEQADVAQETMTIAQGDNDLDIFGDKFPYYVSIRMFAKKPDTEYEGIKQEDLDKFLNSDDDSETAKQFVRGLSRALKEPRRFNDLFNEWLPKTLFVMVPLFAFILRLFHWGKQRVYIHQLVFSLHFHSFLFLLLSALIVVVPAFGGAYGFGLFWWGASLYLIIALKVGENQGWIRAFLKAGFIWVSYAILMTAGLAYAVFEGMQEL